MELVALGACRGAERAQFDAGQLGAPHRQRRLALDLALAAIREGRHDALVTAPVSKESLALAEGPADGHTPYLGRAFGVGDPLMAFVWDDAEPVVALLTTHIPLRAVASTLTGAKVERAVHILHDALVTRFGRARAR
ncbi:MAG: 4-hydroxythreonine-4-phosphate dehydrogenase PdxA, partial [Planctomycetaceae bacterium]|nr:4-hydroxythreonine-4-phosphate dehydrogenase PdxA [Planctomycetaceae bacterium]